MSEQTQQPTVSNAFAKPPRAASDFYDRYTRSEAGQAAQGSNEQTQPHVESQHVSVGTRGPATPSPLDRPYQEPAQVTPQPLQTPQAPQYAQSPQDRQLIQQLAQERDAYLQQMQAQQAQLNQLMQERAEQAAKDREASFEEQLMQAPEMQELESLDPEDARRIARATAKAMSTRMDTLQNELAQQRQQTAQAVQFVQQREMDAERRQWANDVVKVHPDFLDLYKDPAFLQYLNGRDGYNRFTRDELATAEFNAGNTAYVIDMIDRFKKGRPNASHVASVAPVQTAGAAYAGSQRQAAPVNFSLADLNNLMQTRQITQDEYRKRLDAWRAANSQ